MRKKNIIDVAKWILFLAFLYGWVQLLIHAPSYRQIRNYMRAQHRPLYNKLVNADCNTLEKELDSVLKNSDNPEPKIIKFIERRMDIEKCN